MRNEDLTHASARQRDANGASTFATEVGIDGHKSGWWNQAQSKADKQAVANDKMPALRGKRAKSQAKGHQQAARRSYIAWLKTLDGRPNKQAREVQGQTVQICNKCGGECVLMHAQLALEKQSKHRQYGLIGHL